VMGASLSAVENRGVLFAQVYIDSILASLKDAHEFALLETFSEWFVKADRSSLVSYVSSFIGPVLDVQGFVRGELSGNVVHLFEDRTREKVLSLCYIVGSDESLDQTTKGKNYAVSLVMALKKTGLRWGILTNGHNWRLYYTREKAPFETFFQIDVGKVVENRNAPEVALFAHFFNVRSFLLDEKGNCQLEAFRLKSEEATREIEEHLQSKMEDILGKICMGFIKSEGKNVYTEGEKRTVFNNSIYLLYRLLFILYAEARGFLPVQNPKYYEKMSLLLDTLIRERRQKALEYEQYLAQIVELTKQVQNPISSTSYPKTLNTSAKRALYDNLGNDEQLALKLDEAIRNTKKDDWRGNRIKEREVRYVIRRYVTDAAEIQRIFELIRNQSEY